MWYAILGGAGLLLGLGLMIFVLVERSKRHTAERAADTAKAGESAALDHLATARETVNTQAAELTRTRLQVETIRTALNAAREQLVQCKDPASVKAWLDEQLKEEVL